jgi:membrane associated rhomboid family serine protease
MTFVRLTRTELFVTALLMLPGFAFGSWLLGLTGIGQFSFHDALEGFNGALVMAFVLACTRGEQP